MCAALPTFDIGEGALDKVLGIYKQLLPGMGGYLTHAGDLDKSRLQLLLAQLAALEQSVLEERAAVRSKKIYLFPLSFCFLFRV